MPPACSIEDPRSNAPETLCKLLYLRAVRGSLLATSNNGTPLFGVGLIVSCYISHSRPLCFLLLRTFRSLLLGEAYLLMK